MSLFQSLSVGASAGAWFPQDCALCGALAPSLLCAPCHAELPPARAGCPQCAAPGTADDLCGQCLRSPPQFDATVSAFRYDFPLDRLVQSFKFNGNLAFSHLFAQALVEQVRGYPVPNVIVAVPLAKARLLTRGFNQSALVAAEIAKALSVRCDNFGLLKTRETVPQAGLDRDARHKNVKGAFACSTPLTGLTVAVVDDVMTTGATLSEAARALKAQGAARVVAWVVARADRLR